MDQFTIDQKYELGRSTQKFIRLLREREIMKEKGEPCPSDNDLLYLLQSNESQKQIEEAKKKTYVGNDYFVKNYEKYKTVNENPEENRIFPELTPKDFNSSPIFKDNIIAGYIYCVIRNRLRKYGYYFGVIEE